MNTLHRSLLLTALLSTFVFPAWSKKQADPTSKVSMFRVDYRLVLAADGSIELLKAQNETISPVLTDNLEKQIRRWKFTPGKVSGVTQRTETNLSLSIEAVPEAGGDYQVRIVNANTGVWLTPGKMVAPRYPVDELRNGGEAVLSLLVTYDADGRVTDAVRPGEKIKGMASFELASIQAVKQWRFEPEKIGDQGVPGSALIPIRFCTAESKCKKLLSGSKAKEKLAQDFAAQLTPVDSKVSILRETL
jgi:TonB family protein